MSKLIKQFETTVKQHKNKTAIKHHQHSTTYHQLNSLTNQLAHFIIKNHPTQKNIAILNTHNTPAITAILATLKANKTYTPLNPNFPPHHLTKTIKHLDITTIITTPQHLPTIQHIQKITGTPLNIINIENIPKNLPTNNPNLNTPETSPAYIITTSGSSGKPKSVIQTHQNLHFFTNHYINTLNITPADHLTFLSSFSFDGALEDIYPALLSGATLHPLDIAHHGITAIAPWLKKEHITIYHSVPTLFRYFTNTLTPHETSTNAPTLPSEGQSGVQGEPPPGAPRAGAPGGPPEAMSHSPHFPRLRIICMGAEPVYPRDLAVMHKFFPGVTFAHMYGQTESSLNTMELIDTAPPHKKLTLGQPLEGVSLYLIDEGGEEVETFETGEILVASEHVAAGYYDDPEETERCFIDDQDLGRLYFTGDLGRGDFDGRIELLGRKDRQVKIHGFRIDPGEIETALAAHPQVAGAAVIAAPSPKNTKTTGHEEAPSEQILYAYLVLHQTSTTAPNLSPEAQSGPQSGVQGEPPPGAPRVGAPGGPPEAMLDASELRLYLGETLPPYMIPGEFICVEAMPLTANGKIDRAGLRDSGLGIGTSMGAAAAYIPPQSLIEQQVAREWKALLRVDKIGVHDNFFDLGGNSLKIMELNSRLSKLFKKEIPLARVFEHSTIRTQAAYLDDTAPTPREDPLETEPPPSPDDTRNQDIAVIGMACRFPGARDIDQFWENLKQGKESISFFSDEELTELGIDEQHLRHPNYVKAAAIVEDKDYFDPFFFGYTPREAQLLDPQVRVFHECCWQGLEHAGINPVTHSGPIGVYAGASHNREWEVLQFLSGRNPAFSDFAASKLMGVRFLCTRVSYQLDLSGPSVSLQTACSTSMAAIHTAARALLDGQCGTALAGGVTLSPMPKWGYFYQEQMIFSPDGHCRAFDADAGGTVFGEGAGVVVLTTLDRAIRDKHTIYAVIKGSAMNNDGRRKVGFTAPGIEGQAGVIRAALQTARVHPETVSYVETHGTGTRLGDVVEIDALKQSFGPLPKNSCALGSVKTNLGHLDAAAGVAGFIKTVLSLAHRAIPPSLHFNQPNPACDFPNSPFYVNTRLEEWKREEPLRAGISSFGIGGTNIHAVLEEPPADALSPGEVPGGEEQPHHLLLLSARTPAALDRMTRNLADHLERRPHTRLPDAAYTLQLGRKHFPHRRTLVCSNVSETLETLSSLNPRRVTTHHLEEQTPPPVVFMFPGQGTHYIDMGRDLYLGDPLFRAHMDHGFQAYREITGQDLKAMVYPASASGEAPALTRQEVIQPLLFIFQHALARVFMQRGIRPHAFTGYSFGEFTAAALAGVFHFPDALRFLVLRGQLMRELPPGLMLSVPLPEEQVKPLLAPYPRVSLAVVNGPSCIVSGAAEEVEQLERELKSKKYLCMRLNVAFAGHSSNMEPMVCRLEQEMATVTLNPPNIPIISSITGRELTQSEARDPLYWARHITGTVRFMQGMEELVKIPHALFLETGPGRTLQTMVKRLLHPETGQKVLDLVPGQGRGISSAFYFLQRTGQCWLYGLPIRFETLHNKELSPLRIPLPSYPFERQYFGFSPEVYRAAANFALGDNLRPVEEDPVAPNETQQQPAVPGVDGAPAETGRAGLSSEYVAPVTAEQQELVRIWRDFSGLALVGIEDDFFELGGDSLKAILVINSIRQAFGTELSMNDLFANPTIRRLAPLLAAPASVPHPGAADLESVEQYITRPMITFNPAKAGRNIFCFPPGFAYGFAYRELAKVLPDYCFHAFNFNDPVEPVERFTRLVLETQAQGPYILLGYSAAGKLTFEVAEALEQRGLTVSHIILADAFWPDDHISNEVPQSVIDGMTDYLEELNLSQFKDQVLSGVIHYRKYMKEDLLVKDIRAQVHLLAARERWGSPVCRCWDAYTAQKTKIYQAAGNHSDMLSPPAVQENAQVIERIINPSAGKTGGLN